MVYRGKVHNGQIVIEGGSQLVEGTEVHIQPVGPTPWVRGSVEAILGTDAHWHGTDDELYRLLADLKRSKEEELQRQLSEPEGHAFLPLQEIGAIESLEKAQP